MGEVFYTVTALFAVSFVLTVLLARWLIPLLRRRRAGQPILEIGPAWHLSKAGTPTLGGLAFIGGIAVSATLGTVFFCIRGEAAAMRPLALVLTYALLCGAIGLFDDLQKLSKRQNQGLSAAQKYCLQLAVSALLLFAARAWLGVDTALRLPFGDGVLELGFFYYPFALLYLTGLVNAANLTDGVDGLLSATVAVVAAFFLLWGAAEGREYVMLIGGVLLGGALGFLCFNAHPAKVFMGDTGSLFLGGALSAVGLLTEHPLLVLLSCGVFVIEAFSVIAQVLYFKISHGKRLLRMAPLHHHLEKCGWSEWRVVAVLAAASLVFCALAFLGR